MKKEWPAIETQQPEFKGSGIGIAQSEMNLAQARLEMAKSEAWPNLKLGPSVHNKHQTESDLVLGNMDSMFRDSIAPVSNQCSSGKKVAALGTNKSGSKHGESQRRELEIEKKILITQYQNAVQSLQQAVSSREIEQRHNKIDQLFERGVVTSSLVIEAHRQMLDFTKNRHQQEVNALDAWMKIRALEGKLFEEKL
jgi:cobalt-zinc-cadmium efflux system outer membrane protein